jgi:hypothetical protein
VRPGRRADRPPGGTTFYERARRKLRVNGSAEVDE